MRTMCPPAGVPGGSPFDSESDRLFWLAGYVNEFDTAEEAEEAIAAVKQLPGCQELVYEIGEG